MPRRLESDLEKRVVKAAEDSGWTALKLVAVGRRGMPDRWFIKPGPVIKIIEFKRESTYAPRVRKLQQYVCDRLTDLGFEVHAGINSWEDAKEILDL